MNTKRLYTWIAVGLLSLSAVGAVSAQRGGGMPGGMRGGEGRPGAMLDLVGIVTEASGMTPLELREELQAGKSLATIITEAGGDVEAVKQEALTVITEAINQRVAEGKMTQEQADTAIANMTSRIDEALNSTEGLLGGPGGEGGMFGGRGGEGGGRGGEQGGRGGRGGQALEAVVTATGLTAEEIRAQLEAGNSLGSVLEGAGVDVNAFIEEQLATLQTRLDEQVAAGRISQELADARLTLARLELAERINRVPTPPTAPAEVTPQANS